MVAAAAAALSDEKLPPSSAVGCRRVIPSDPLYNFSFNHLIGIYIILQYYTRVGVMVPHYATIVSEFNILYFRPVEICVRPRGTFATRVSLHSRKIRCRYNNIYFIHSYVYLYRKRIINRRGPLVISETAFVRTSVQSRLSISRLRFQDRHLKKFKYLQII